VERLVKDYLAGGASYQYPGVGDKPPPGGAKVNLLTRGGICVQGSWNNSGSFLGWAPLPTRDKEKERRLRGDAEAQG
jgi:hypothetical protein